MDPMTRYILQGGSPISTPDSEEENSYGNSGQEFQNQRRLFDSQNAYADDRQAAEQANPRAMLENRVINPAVARMGTGQLQVPRNQSGFAMPNDQNQSFAEAVIPGGSMGNFAEMAAKLVGKTAFGKVAEGVAPPMAIFNRLREAYAARQRQEEQQRMYAQEQMKGINGGPMPPEELQRVRQIPGIQGVRG